MYSTSKQNNTSVRKIRTLAITHRSFVTAWCAVRHGPTGFYHQAVGLTCRFWRTKRFLACEQLEGPLDWRCFGTKIMIILSHSQTFSVQNVWITSTDQKDAERLRPLGSPAQPHRPPPQSDANENEYSTMANHGVNDGFSNG